MIAYHVFRDNDYSKAHPGLEINYMGNGEPGNPFLLTPEQYQLISRCYPKGVSRHGFRYLCPAERSCESTINHVIESIFELVRQNEFSDQPSRFQSAFACLSLDDARKWAEQFGKCEIWSIELNSNPPQFDAHFLKIDENGAYSHVQAINNARKYWGHRLSDQPEIEMLVPLPFKLGTLIERR